MGHFRLFHKQITENIVSIKVGDDWIRTADQITEKIVSVKVADDWIRTVDPMVSEATTRITKPQPLPWSPQFSLCWNDWKNKNKLKGGRKCPFLIYKTALHKLDPSVPAIWMKKIWGVNQSTWTKTAIVLGLDTSVKVITSKYFDAVLYSRF